MKKRILSLVLTAATILTMTACGSNSEETNKPSSGNTNALTTNSTESDVTQPGDASVPEKEAFKFAGTWRKIQETAEPSKEYLVIDTAGNVTWYDEWSEEPEEYILNDEKPIKKDDDGETIFDQLPDVSEDTLPEAVVEDEEFRTTLLNMINSLPAEQTNALLLYYYEKRSVGEIARI